LEVGIAIRTPQRNFDRSFPLRDCGAIVYRMDRSFGRKIARGRGGRCFGYIFTGFGSVVFVGAAALVMIRTSEVARVLGQLGLVVAAIQVVYLFTAFFTGGLMVGGGPITIAGFTLLGLWLLGVSVMMIVRAPATGKTAL